VGDIPHIRTPDGALYSIATTSVTKGLSVTLVSAAPPPAPVQADPDFDAAAFFPHVLQQLYFRDRALLTDILLTQGFTPGQIATVAAAITEF
jgi:hypothetical protein